MILLTVDSVRKHFGPEPVLDGVTCALRLAEAMAGLRLTTSRRGGYAPPRLEKHAG